MTIKESLSFAICELKKSDIPTSTIDALLILETVLKKDDVFILTNPDYKLSEKEIEELKKTVKIRQKNYPIAYIKHLKEFYGFEFYVDRNVLIPRPETEMLVDKCLLVAKEFSHPTIVDVGCGSGAISITLSKILNTKIYASDISCNAVKIAKFNAERLDANVDFLCADTLTFLKKKVDIIVSNPPYIDSSEYQNLQKDVKYEPVQALICKNGTDIIAKLIKQAKFLCRYLILEIGYDQEGYVSEHKECILVKRDLSNLPRVAVFKF